MEMILPHGDIINTPPVPKHAADSDLNQIFTALRAPRVWQTGKETNISHPKRFLVLVVEIDMPSDIETAKVMHV